MYDVAPILTWCDACGLPILGRDRCMACHGETRRLDYPEPASFRPVFSNDLQWIGGLVDGFAGTKVSLPAGDLYFLNLAGHCIEILAGGRVLGAFVEGGGFVPAWFGAGLILETWARLDVSWLPTREIQVDDAAAEFIARGRNVLAPGVVRVSPEIKRGEYCLVTTTRRDELLAIAQMAVPGAFAASIVENASRRGSGEIAKVKAWARKPRRHVLPSHVSSRQVPGGDDSLVAGGVRVYRSARVHGVQGPKIDLPVPGLDPRLPFLTGVPSALTTGHVLLDDFLQPWERMVRANISRIDGLVAKVANRLDSIARRMHVNPVYLNLDLVRDNPSLATAFLVLDWNRFQAEDHRIPVIYYPARLDARVRDNMGDGAQGSVQGCGPGREVASPAAGSHYLSSVLARIYNLEPRDCTGGFPLFPRDVISGWCRMDTWLYLFHMYFQSFRMVRPFTH